MSRVGPAKVNPIIIQNRSYEPNTAYPGYLFVKSSPKGDLLWIQQIYPLKIDSDCELDVQEVYFKSMNLSADSKQIDIVNEANQTFHLAIGSDAGAADWPAKIELKNLVNKKDDHQIVIGLRIPNPSKAILHLDGLSVVEKGVIENSVFQVFADEKKLAYQGKMKKRMPPDSFIEVKPGHYYETKVDIAKYFEIPEKTKTLNIQFRTMNHFSSEKVTFISNELKVNLDRK